MAKKQRGPGPFERVFNAAALVVAAVLALGLVVRTVLEAGVGIVLLGVALGATAVVFMITHGRSRRW